MNTIWNKETEIPGRRSLNGDLETDIAVIGAGMAGILTAFFLAEEGRLVTVLEAGRIAGGQTGGTTAKITSQHGLIYQKLESRIGKDAARLYAAANQQAIEDYEQLIGKYSIACGYTRLPAFLYSTHEETALRRETAAACRAGIHAQFVTDTELPFPVRGAVRFPKQAQFDPIRFLAALAPSLSIYEHTPVLKVEEAVRNSTRNEAFAGHPGHISMLLTTPHGQVRANEVVFACHYPFLNIPGYYFLRMYQQRSYVLALSHAPRLHGMYLGIDRDGLSFRHVNREAGDVLLLGGHGHRTGQPKGHPYQALSREARRLYPQAHICAAWSAQDCIPLDGLPYIGRFSSRTPHWYVASGFGKWGMTLSMTAAHLLTDQICGRRSPYEKLFTPQRFHLRASAAKLAVHSAESAKGLITGIGKGPSRCPHMGCGLKWNPAENAWECPCHGSRFDSGGKLLCGPAQTDMRQF